jgi:hypothetical protein
MEPNEHALLWEYLEYSGATAISVAVNESGAAQLRVGRKFAREFSDYTTFNCGHISTVFWLDAKLAAVVARQARLAAGSKPTVSSLTQALHAAAAKRRAVLTPNVSALLRAASLVRKLISLLEQYRTSGALKEFNAEYKRRRAAAEAKGSGFMPYGTAMLRLRRLLISIITKKHEVARMQSLFEKVFADDNIDVQEAV